MKLESESSGTATSDTPIAKRDLSYRTEQVDITITNVESEDVVAITWLQYLIISFLSIK
jgi:hypothetical protein